MWYIYLTFSFLYTTVACDCDSARKPFKYRIERWTDDHKQYTENSSGPIITNEKKAYYIELQEDIPVLCKGILNITERTHHFWAYNSGIETLEPGVFDNQVITSQLRLAVNSIRIIKKGTFRNLAITDLELQHNKISTIEEGAFENLPNLHLLYLYKNEIINFYPNSVINTPELDVFSIGSNKLGKTVENMFGFLHRGPRFVVFDMSENELEEIHPKTFGTLSGFINFGVSENKLKRIPINLFKDYVFEIVELANNSLITLPVDFFNQRRLTYVDLRRNNFTCSTVSKLKLFKEIITFNINFDDNSSTCVQSVIK